MFSGLSQRIIGKLFILMLSADGSSSAKTGDAGLQVQGIKIKQEINTTCINNINIVNRTGKCVPLTLQSRVYLDRYQRIMQVPDNISTK